MRSTTAAGAGRRRPPSARRSAAAAPLGGELGDQPGGRALGPVQHQRQQLVGELDRVAERLDRRVVLEGHQLRMSRAVRRPQLGRAGAVHRRQRAAGALGHGRADTGAVGAAGISARPSTSAATRPGTWLRSSRMVPTQPVSRHRLRTTTSASLCQVTRIHRPSPRWSGMISPLAGNART